jgi:hypothetical protein
MRYNMDITERELRHAISNITACEMALDRIKDKVTDSSNEGLISDSELDHLDSCMHELKTFENGLKNILRKYRRNITSKEEE